MLLPHSDTASMLPVTLVASTVMVGWTARRLAMTMGAGMGSLVSSTNAKLCWPLSWPACTGQRRWNQLPRVLMSCTGTSPVGAPSIWMPRPIGAIAAWSGTYTSALIVTTLSQAAGGMADVLTEAFIPRDPL